MTREFEATIGERGQVVIPKPIRDAYDLRAGQTVRFAIEEGQIVIRGNEETLATFLDAIDKRPEPDAIDWDDRHEQRFV